jgi:hypothetical protein
MLLLLLLVALVCSALLNGGGGGCAWTGEDIGGVLEPASAWTLGFIGRQGRAGQGQQRRR